MAGVFAQWQPQYAARGIATFPVKDKKPAVRHWLQMGLRASDDLVNRFPESDALGLACRRNGITVVDVDSPDDGLLAEALDEFGPTPFIVRSGSGNFQAWYRHGGEGRRVRPDPSRPIDILGHGLVVAPPSRGNKGSYAIISGSLDDLSHLPYLKRRRDATAVEDVKQALSRGPLEGCPAGKIEQGRRNSSLWRECMREAHACVTMAELMRKAAGMNATMFYEPLSDEEVFRVVASAWLKTEAGENWFGRAGKTVLANEHVDLLACEHPDALILLTVLKRHHWGRSEFAVANDMHVMLGMTRKRLAAARKHLEEIGELVMVRAPGAMTGPGIYRFRGGQN
jgi:hypothetical protein